MTNQPFEAHVDAEDAQILAAVLKILSDCCFLPWVKIEKNQMKILAMDTEHNLLFSWEYRLNCIPQKCKQKLKFHLRTIVIGEEYGYVQHSLKTLSDQLTPVAALTDDVAAEVFENV